MNGQLNIQTNRHTDRRMVDSQADGRTDGPTDRRTDGQSNRPITCFAFGVWWQGCRRHFRNLPKNKLDSIRPDSPDWPESAAERLPFPPEGSLVAEKSSSTGSDFRRPLSQYSCHRGWKDWSRKDVRWQIEVVVEYFFLVMRVLDLDSQYWSGQIQNIESLKRLYSVRWVGDKWPRRPLGGELQCGGLRPLCEGWLGGSSFEEGVGQPDRVP